MLTADLGGISPYGWAVDEVLAVLAPGTRRRAGDGDLRLCSHVWVRGRRLAANWAR
jgi:hypothetical protein